MLLNIIPPNFDIESLGIILLLIDRLVSWLGKSKPDTLIKIYTDYRMKSKGLIAKENKKALEDSLIELESLRANNSYLTKEITRYNKIHKIVDSFRDKYNFKRVHTTIFSNGVVNLAGGGLFYYSIDVECTSYKEDQIKSLYQREALSPFYELVQACVDNDFWDNTKQESIKSVDRVLNTLNVDRIITTGLIVNGDIIGFLNVTFGEYTTYPNISEESEEQEERQAQSDLMYARHAIESIYKKYI